MNVAKPLKGARVQNFALVVVEFDEYVYRVSNLVECFDRHNWIFL